MLAYLIAFSLTQGVGSKLLDNGVRLLAHRIPGAVSYSAQTFIRTGSIYESAETNGVNHLLEHMLFRGSGGSLDDKAERAGSFLNATTYSEFMKLFCNGPREGWREGAEAVAGLLREPSLQQATMEREVKIIEQEIAYLHLDNEGWLEEELYRKAFDASPWALPAAGKVETIKKLSREQVLENYRKKFVGGNIVACLSGDFDIKEALALLEKSYSQVHKGAVAKATKMPDVTAKNESLSSGDRFVFGFVAPGLNDIEKYVACESILDTLCGASGRAAAVGLNCKSFFGPSATGTLAVLVFRKSDGGACEPATRKVLADLSAGLTAEELAYQKKRLAAVYGKHLKNPADLATLEGLGWLFEGSPIVDDFLPAVNSLSIDSVNKLCRALDPNP